MLKRIGNFFFLSGPCCCHSNVICHWDQNIMLQWSHRRFCHLYDFSGCFDIKRINAVYADQRRRFFAHKLITAAFRKFCHSLSRAVSESCSVSQKNQLLTAGIIQHQNPVIVQYFDYPIHKKYLLHLMPVLLLYTTTLGCRKYFLFRIINTP